MSARAATLGRPARPRKAAKAKGKQRRKRSAALPLEYNLLLTATLCLLALGDIHGRAAPDAAFAERLLELRLADHPAFGAVGQQQTMLQLEHRAGLRAQAQHVAHLLAVGRVHGLKEVVQQHAAPLRLHAEQSVELL